MSLYLFVPPSPHHITSSSFDLSKEKEIERQKASWTLYTFVGIQHPQAEGQTCTRRGETVHTRHSSTHQVLGEEKVSCSKEHKINIEKFPFYSRGKKLIRKKTTKQKNLQQPVFPLSVHRKYKFIYMMILLKLK